MEEIVVKGKEVGFEYHINNFYMDYAFISANGGYVYKEKQWNNILNIYRNE